MKKVRILQDSERFIVEEIIHNNTRAVLKCAKSPQMYRNLANEKQAYEIYGVMAQQADCPFYISEIIDSGTDWIIMSYLDGEVMSDCMNAANKSEYLELLARIMAYIDEKVIDNARSEPVGLTADELNKQRSRTKTMLAAASSMDENMYKDLIMNIQRVTDYYENHSGTLQRCFVNADVTPRHVMLGREKPAIFDFENAITNGPRFSDVINMATKLWFIDGDETNAKAFFTNYWKLKKESSKSYNEQLKILMYRRCLGFTYELITKPNQYHNTSLEMNSYYSNNILNVIAWADEL